MILFDVNYCFVYRTCLFLLMMREEGQPIFSTSWAIISPNRKFQSRLEGQAKWEAWLWAAPWILRCDVLSHNEVNSFYLIYFWKYHTSDKFHSIFHVTNIWPEKKKKRFNHRAGKVEFINNDVLKGESFLFPTNGKSLNYSYWRWSCWNYQIFLWVGGEHILS